MPAFSTHTTQLPMHSHGHNIHGTTLWSASMPMYWLLESCHPPPRFGLVELYALIKTGSGQERGLKSKQ
jgi:hypothetical protein